MTQLHQIIAVSKGVAGDTERKLTQAYHAIQKSGPLSGISRTYRAIDDEGEKLPSESTRVQVNAEDVLQDVAKIMSRLFDITATKDYANCEARADLVVDEEVLLTEVPVTYLLFLDKQLINIHTFVSKLPLLDPASAWTRDDNAAAWRASAVETTRTKKMLRNHVKAEATDKHPAQVDVYTEDVVVGYWTKTDFSGALPRARVNELLERVEKLQAAVKYARESANTYEVNDETVSTTIFDYLFR